MSKQMLVCVAVGLFVLACACPDTFADLTPSFQGLGDLTGGEFFSMAWGVSDDGSTVVGNSYSASGNEAFRWTATGGMVGLGYLAGGSNISGANAVSADGSVIVGWSNSATADDGYEAFRWEEGGMTGLGVPVGHQTSEAFAVSDDGQTIVARAGYRCGFIWKEGEWTPLNTWPDTINVMDPRDISPDGSVIVGHFSSEVPNLDEAFLWRDGEMTPLGMRYSYASAVSADGQTVVGTVSGDQACIWTPELGMVYLQSLLEDEFGLDLSGWNLMAATGISADGLTVVGHGFNPLGSQEGWIVRLPDTQVVPAPGAFLLGVLGLGFSGWRLRKQT